jgi:hypothetical protein
VIAFNAFKTRIKKSVAQTDLLGRTLLAHLHTESSTDSEGKPRTGRPDGSAE